MAEDGGHAGLSPPEGGAQPGAQKSGKPGSARVCVNTHVRVDTIAPVMHIDTNAPVMEPALLEAKKDKQA